MNLIKDIFNRIIDEIVVKVDTEVVKGATSKKQDWKIEKPDKKK